ncbi:uncharacterized protein LOC121732894 [Aricia agestis]|uniref:uncharacterized protein LOC121732894 n=1 Tax=Aricia agestis TaxID=91739 RepID=UPI001C201FC8|nr:uncharacterized protein LOC121732894 [Aricia agestis]XP_041978853.1 uncharacterized protein LOC121732894 [Aricia agestis]
MNMFASVLARIPSNRSELLTELDYPDYISLPPYLYDYEPSLGDDTDSMSSIALSSTMVTDKEFDSYRKSKAGTYDDPWQLMRESLNTFPQDYLDSLSSFYTPSDILAETRYVRDPYIEDLRLRMERFFEEECRVFGPHDPGLLALEKAINELDLDSDSESSSY